MHERIDPKVLEAERRELEKLAGLSHPCRLRIVGVSLPTSRSPRQVGTEFAVNGWLQKALDARCSGSVPRFMDETGIAMIISGIALGMQFIHSRGVIHRCLKPSNILINRQGRLMIGGVGINQLFDLDTTFSAARDQRLYTAPELYTELIGTPAVDVFSFALILCELLVGDSVFPPGISQAQLTRHVADPGRPPLP